MRTYTRHKRQMTLIKRVEDYAIFESKDTFGNISYEVVKIRRHNGFTIAGRHIPPGEQYPYDEEWGLYGFTATNLCQAEHILNREVQKRLKNAV